MYQTQEASIRPHMKMADLINENYSRLLLLEHLDYEEEATFSYFSELLENGEGAPVSFYGRIFYIIQEPICIFT